MQVMPDEKTVRAHIMRVAGVRDKNEKLSWSRKKKNLEAKIADELVPIEEQIAVLLAKKNKIIDEVQEVRTELVRECVHPTDYLVHMGNHIKCKFCNAKLSIPRDA